MEVSLFVRCVCTQCQKEKTLLIPRRGYEEWKQGKFIQDALPELSADDRKLLISQTCGECFDKMFSAGAYIMFVYYPKHDSHRSRTDNMIPHGSSIELVQAGINLNYVKFGKETHLVHPSFCFDKEQRDCPICGNLMNSKFALCLSCSEEGGGD